MGEFQLLHTFLFLFFVFFWDLERRDLSHKEKLYLRELNVITETQCTLGKKNKLLDSLLQ